MSGNGRNGRRNRANGNGKNGNGNRWAIDNGQRRRRRKQRQRDKAQSRRFVIVTIIVLLLTTAGVLAAAAFTGAQARKTAGANFRSGVSADQIPAQRVGDQTRIASHQLGIEKFRGSGN